MSIEIHPLVLFGLLFGALVIGVLGGTMLANADRFPARPRRDD